MWLILGANGQLGRAVQLKLGTSNIQFVAMGSRECDITDPAAVGSAFAYSKPDVVVNCAAWTAVDAAEDNEPGASAVNCDGPRNIARLCKQVEAVFVHFSTDYVFSGLETGPYPEDFPTRPLSTYGRTKLCGEIAALGEHPEGTYVVRTAWLYGEGGNNFVKTMIRRALADSPVRVVDDQRGQPTLTDDLAQHVVDLVNARVPFGIYHGTNSGEGTWCDLAREIYRLANKDPELVTAVTSQEYPTKATRPKNSVLGHQRTIAAGHREMQNWKNALVSSFDGILREVEKES